MAEEKTTATNNKDTTHSEEGQRASVCMDRLNAMTVLDVGEWLKNSVGLGQYVELFKEHDIDGKVLSALTNEDMKDDLAITVLGHRMVILQAIRQLMQ